jgi:hypothetical protein
MESQTICMLAITMPILAFSLINHSSLYTNTYYTYMFKFSNNNQVVQVSIYSNYYKFIDYCLSARTQNGQVSSKL